MVGFDEGRPEEDRRAWWSAYLGGDWAQHVIGGPRAHDIELRDLHRDGALEVQTGSHNIRVTDIGGDGDFDIFGANWSRSTTVDLGENVTQRSTPRRERTK